VAKRPSTTMKTGPFSIGLLTDVASSPCNVEKKPVLGSCPGPPPPLGSLRNSRRIHPRDRDRSPQRTTRPQLSKYDVMRASHPRRPSSTATAPFRSLARSGVGTGGWLTSAAHPSDQALGAVFELSIGAFVNHAVVHDGTSAIPFELVHEDWLEMKDRGALARTHR